MFSALRIFFLLVMAGFPPRTTAARDRATQTTAVQNVSHHSEQLLLNAIEKIRNDDFDGALTELRHLVKLNPQFNLAQLMYADLLSARAHRITDFGNLLTAPYKQITA